MRKLILSLIVALGLWGATSWTATPQWRVIVENHKMGGTEHFRNELVFTPNDATAYRISASCSAIGESFNTWTFDFNWTDFQGHSGVSRIECRSDNWNSLQQVIFVMTPQVGVPVTLSGDWQNNTESAYYGFYTVEELRSEINARTFSFAS